MDSSHHRSGRGAGRRVAALKAHPMFGVGLVVAAAVLFSVNGTVSKLVLDSGFSALRLVEIRCLGASIVFALLAARRAQSLAIRLRDLPFIALYGVVGVAMVQWLYFVAITRIQVSIALLIEFTAPLMIALWIRFVRRHVVRARVWLALGLTVGGLALVGQVWHGLTLDGLGLTAAIAAAVALAVFYLLGEHGLTTRDPLALAAWSFGAAALFWAILLPWWTFPFDALGSSVPITLGGLKLTVGVGVLVIWIVLLGTVVPFGLELVGLRRIGAARVGLIATAEPPLAGVVAWFVLGQSLQPMQIIGGAVVLTGIVLAETARPTGNARAAPQPAASFSISSAA